MLRDVQGYYPPAPRTVRPTGVSILAVLYFINGIAAMAGFFLFAVFFARIPGIALICGAIGILIGVFDFLVGWGLWTLAPWAHTAALVLAIIGLLFFPIGTVISIIILIYLFQPEIKAAFGQGPPPMMAPGYYPPPVQPYPYQYPPQPAQPWGPPPTAPPPTQPAAPGPSSCPNCGRPVGPGAAFCPSCGARLR
jgi:hypothetical protein